MSSYRKMYETPPMSGNRIMLNFIDGDVMKVKREALLAVLAIFLLFPIAYGQDSSASATSKWISINAGAGALSDFAYTLSADVNERFDHYVITIQALYSREFSVFFLPVGHLPREEALSIGLLYGRSYSFHLDRMLFPFFPFALFMKHETRYSFSGAVGVSLLSATLRGPLLKKATGSEDTDTYATEKSLSLGVPLQLEFVQYLSPSVGYIHRLYCVPNGKRVPWGILWGINVNI